MEKSNGAISAPRDGRNGGGTTGRQHRSSMQGLWCQRDLLSLQPKAEGRERGDRRSADRADGCAQDLGVWPVFPAFAQREGAPGETSDYLGFDLVMTDNLPEPRVLLADRGYDSDNIRKTMEARDVLTQIPMRKSRRMRIGVDHSLYSLRNLVERCFNKLKNARRVATRYDKTAESFLGFIDIVSIRLWLRLLST